MNHATPPPAVQDDPLDACADGQFDRPANGIHLHPAQFGLAAEAYLDIREISAMDTRLVSIKFQTFPQ